MSETPKSPEELIELANWAKAKWSGNAEDTRIFASYLVSECGLNAHAAKVLLWDVWREAAEAIHVDAPVQRAQMGRRVVLMLNHRLSVIEHLDKAVKLGELPSHLSELLLEEWDALNFPEQMIEPIRKRALERNRRALALFPNGEP